MKDEKMLGFLCPIWCTVPRHLSKSATVFELQHSECFVFYKVLVNGRDGCLTRLSAKYCTPQNSDFCLHALLCINNHVFDSIKAMPVPPQAKRVVSTGTSCMVPVVPRSPKKRNPCNALNMNDFGSLEKGSAMRWKKWSLRALQNLCHGYWT